MRRGELIDGSKRGEEEEERKGPWGDCVTGKERRRKQGLLGRRWGVMKMGMKKKPTLKT